MICTGKLTGKPIPRSSTSYGNRFLGIFLCRILFVHEFVATLLNVNWR